VLGLQPLTCLPLPALAALSVLITPNPSKGFTVRGCHMLLQAMSGGFASDAVPGGRIKRGYVKCGNKFGTAAAAALLHNRFYAT